MRINRWLVEKTANAFDVARLLLREENAARCEETDGPSDV
jgi:hypothetical protein